MPGQKIEDLYPDGEEFEAILLDAEENSWSNFHQEFTAKIRRSWDNYGLRAFLSDFQNRTLREIAGADAGIDD